VHVISSLLELTAISSRPQPGVGDVRAACDVIARAAGAEDAYVIRAGDPDFIRMGCDCPPREYPIKQKGYWLIWREIAANPGAAFGGFDVTDRVVAVGRPLVAGEPLSCIGGILPSDESSSELLILHGAWSAGLDAEQVAFITVARTVIARLVDNVLDAGRRARQQKQLESLANVSRAFNEAQDTDDILTSIATALSKASGSDWVNLLVFDDACASVVGRALNVARHSGTETAAGFREGQGSGRVEAAMGVELTRRRSQILLPDVFAADVMERPGAELIGDGMPALQKNLSRGHVLSLGVFPIVFQDKPLGLVYFSSCTKRTFAPAEVEFLGALAAQTATALKGVRLYDDLERSRDELRTSEERFRSLVQNSSDLLTIVDAGGTLQYASPSVERLMGYRPDEWVGTSLLALVHPDELAATSAMLNNMAQQRGLHPQHVRRVRHADGSWRYIEITANNLLHDQSIGGIVFNARDITERWHAEQALRESEERFRSLVQNASDLITVIEPDTTVRYQSPSLEHVLGYRAEQIVGTKLSGFIHPDDVGPTLATLSGAMEIRKGIVTAEARFRRRDGTWRDIELVGTDQRENTAIQGLVLNMRDVTERKSLERQLRYQALHDPLTKLANRTRFADRLEHALLRSARTGHRVAVLFMDLDNFKGVNDSLGHTAGDKLLTGVAERAQSCLRPGDTIARLGGDEFAILIDDVETEDAATRVADRLFASMDVPFVLEGKELLVRASVGIALSGGTDTTVDADSLLRDADVAMYVAKSRGKARYEVFDVGMKVSLTERLELLADLQRGVEREEFVLQYQPIFLIESGTLYGLEALVRWRHPRRGMIAPNDFISLAEESGAIIGLGRWILREACRQASAWLHEYPDNPDWTISVNVSVKQLQHLAFVDEVRKALEDTGLAAERLVLEITESVMMQDVPAMMQRLHALKALGLRLAIDDFGTGYSSLSYLREFPFDLLKIDKAFIDDVGQSPDNRDLTSAIIELGKTLHLDLIAEGIERHEQVQRLNSLDCGLGQGFFFAQPLDGPAVVQLLTRGRNVADAA
jgi:diguanylate cyclase (GGDEF)-like protein/PAS domain S-box-containing protein